MARLVTCSKCGESKPADREHFNTRDGSALRPDCKACQSAYLRGYRERNREVVVTAEAEYRKANRAEIAERQRSRYHSLDPDERYAHNRAHAYRYKYGITIEQYEALFSAQGGACAICARPPGTKPLCVDHDHNTGAVRGLLCSQCNTALGVFGDNEAGLRKALDYLATAEVPR